MTIQPNDTPETRLGQFFDLIWGDTEGVVYLPTKDATNKWTKVYYAWPKNRSSVVQHVLLNSGANKDVYFGPALYNTSAVAKIRAKQPISKEDVLGSHVLWCEYDGTAPEEWPTTPSEAGSGDPRSDGSMPEPTLRVQSSGPKNQHVYWRLKEFCTDVEFIERINRIAAYSTNADTSGWDVNQVLRPIESVNFKYANHPTVFVYSETRNEYPSSHFSGFGRVKDHIKHEIDTTDLPDPLQVIGKYTWRPDDLDLINKSKEEFQRDRSNALMRVGYCGAELGLTDVEIYSLLIFLDDKWEKFKHRNDRTKQLTEIINRARQKYPHAVKDPQFTGLLGDNTDVEVAPKYVYGFNELLLADIHIDWIIEGLIPARGIGMVASAPGVGKTQFALQLAVACALNKPLLNYTPVRPHKVMFASLEMNTASLKHFIESMQGAYNGHELEQLDRNLLLFPYGNAINLMLEESRKGFESLIEEHRPEGIYIDSLQKIYLGDLSKDEVRGIYTYLAKLRQQYGVYFFLIHHDRKAQENNKRPRDLSDIYGSVYVTAEPDSVLHLWKPTPESVHMELRELKKRLAVVEHPLTITRGPHLQFEKMDGPVIEQKATGFNGLRESADGGSGKSFLNLG